MAVIVLRIFRHDTFKQWARIGWLFLAQETLAQMGASVDVLRVAFERGPIRRLGLLKLALLEVDVPEL